MTLAFSASLAARGFDVTLDVARGETVAILGPNGAGKSTALEIIAGLLRPDSGHAEWDGTALFRLDGGPRGAWLPPHRRGVSLLAQDALLFPHLSALDNVAFGPRSAGVGTDAARATARTWLAEVEASDLAAVRPGRLSGGQAQRVAIARALAADPNLLLLDEPLAALDAAVAPTIRRMLRRVLEGRTAIVVTHEVLDALTLADRVVVMNRGVVVETGQTREVLERPRHPFTAELAGLNLVLGTRTAGGMAADWGELVAPAASIVRGAAVAAAIRPSAIEVSLEPLPGRDNSVPVTVIDLEPRGDSIRVRADSLSADVSPGRAAALDLAPGDRVFFGFDGEDVSLYGSERPSTLR
ncbi:sulfate/molybdate ABC transporter ATP-binding protein [Lacisediminihabitans profunda]|uniref:ABC transporter ATP-binding protein n=1 Tax=Lacisediminihabitans profunda TaxID=2594790 RepID=A0A5C8UNQ7_9MICO|nr:ABC transporter ATP-binding protein [Lacisediminihabitans profunda]TXN30052.1 ABC transporter ATP-binding protein [Lacisediminihabitans profunda]